MDGQKVLADTSLFIEHLRARSKGSTHLYRLVQSAEVETCAIVAAEVFYGARNPEAETQARAVLRPFLVHPFTVEMASRQCTILPELRKQNRIPDLRDLMISVTALELELPIATLNPAHFEPIPGLELAQLSPASS